MEILSRGHPRGYQSQLKFTGPIRHRLSTRRLKFDTTEYFLLKILKSRKSSKLPDILVFKTPISSQKESIL